MNAPDGLSEPARRLFDRASAVTPPVTVVGERARRRTRRRFGAIGVLAALVVGRGALVVERRASLEVPASPRHAGEDRRPDTVMLHIPAGTTLDNLLSRLSAAGGWPVGELRRALDSGDVVSPYLPSPLPTLPAGFSAWEGLLSPGDFEVRPAWSAAHVLQMLADSATLSMDLYGYRNAHERVGYTPYQVLTLASIVQVETSVPDDQAMVARVYLNRRAAGNFLGADSTTRYGQRKPTGELVEADFDPSDTYNTRGRDTVGRWPPTPIGAVSRSALKAAIAPAEGPWRWCVARFDQPARLFCTDAYIEFLREKNKWMPAGEPQDRLVPAPPTTQD